MKAGGMRFSPVREFDVLLIALTRLARRQGNRVPAQENRRLRMSLTVFPSALGPKWARMSRMDCMEFL